MDLLLNKIENTMTQLIPNLEALSERNQHVVDTRIPTLLDTINNDIIPKLDRKSLKAIMENKKSLELRHIRTRDDEQKKHYSEILIKVIDLIIFKALPVNFNLEKVQEAFWTLYKLPEDDYVGNFLRTLDRFYNQWIQSFQNKPKTRENFVAISGVFCLSIKHGVLFESSELSKKYKNFASKLALFNTKEEIPLVLDPTFFPKIRYHSSPNKPPSLCLVGYQKAYYINNDLDMDMSFEEKRANDCCVLDGSSIHGSRMMTCTQTVEMVVPAIELGFKTVFLELSEFSPLFDTMNVTILKEKVKDPYELIHSINLTSYPIIDSKIGDERMIYSTLINRFMDSSADMIMN